MKDFRHRFKKISFYAVRLSFRIGDLCRYLSALGSRRFFKKPVKRYRKHIYAFLALFIIVLLQHSLFYRLRILNTGPDAVLAALVLFVLFFDLRWLVVFAFFGGVLRDIFSVLPFGFNVVFFVLWIILANQISRRLSVENNFIRSALLCLIILLNNLSMQFVLLVYSRPVGAAVFVKIFFIESMFTLLLSFPMYRAFCAFIKD